MQFQVDCDGESVIVRLNGLQVYVAPGSWPAEEDGERTVIRIDSKEADEDLPALVVRVDGELLVNRS